MKSGENHALGKEKTLISVVGCETMAINTNCHVTAKRYIDIGFGRIFAASFGVVDPQPEPRDIPVGIKGNSRPSDF